MKTAKNLILLQLLLCLIIVTLSSCNIWSKGQIVYIENAKIKLGFDKNTGSFLVFQDLVNSHEFLDTNIITSSLWEVDFLRTSGIEKIDMTTPSEFHFSKRDSYTLILKWIFHPGSTIYRISRKQTMKRFGIL